MTQDRKVAIHLWNQRTLKTYTEAEYFDHRDACPNMKLYFPMGGIPKSTYELLPLPEHAQRPSVARGNTETCPSCDTRVWHECLKKAASMTF